MVYKNSYGLTDSDSNLGYMYIIHNNYATSLNRTFYLVPPITSLNYSSEDIVLEDADGDGYYFWGIGPKPSNCPSWVPNEPDGDDSDINYGPMNEYGYLEQNTCVLINKQITFTGNKTLSCMLEIDNGGVLTISGTTTMIGNSQIRVYGGGILIVDGGILNNANLILDSGCTVIVRNGGVVNMAPGKTFEAPTGTIINVESGEFY